MDFEREAKLNESLSPGKGEREKTEVAIQEAA
jgi:hypothetical protein